MTVLVVQMATGTFSARIMRLWFRDRLLKATLAILVGTLTIPGPVSDTGSGVRIGFVRVPAAPK